MILLFSSFFIFTGLIHSLSGLAHARLPGALAQSTNRAYSAMFKMYLAFLAFASIQPNQVNVHVALAFLECLNFNKVRFSQMANYISAIKSFSTKFGLNFEAFEHRKIGMYLKSLQKSSPLSVKLHQVIDVKILRHIVNKCDLTYMGPIFKVAYILGFFGFLRLSNLVPHTTSLFNHTKHLAQGDIIFTKSHVIVLLKWTKTMQLNNQIKLLKLPYLHNELCPARALKTCLALVPGGSNAPLLQFKLFQNWIPLTDSRVRRHLRNILSLLGYHPSFITFHSFRRSGATLAFNNNVPLQDIQRHGTWTSDCVWRYVTDTSDAGAQVADTFASLCA